VPSFTEIAGDDVSSSRYRVLAALRDGATSSRAQLARVTGLAPSTITGLVQSLTADQVIVEVGSDPDEGVVRTGPRSRGLSLNPKLGTVLGIDFGFRTVRVLLADLTARQIALRQAALPENYTAAQGLKIASGLVQDVLAQAALTVSSVLVAGVALPGPVNTTEQCIVGSSILPGWAGCGAAEITETIGIPSVVENDSNLAALGEHAFGAGRGTVSSLTVKLHSGVGAGLMLNGSLISGAHGGAGEIGHIQIDPRGPMCRCGKRGCLDTYAAVPSILSAMRPQHEINTVGQLMDLLHSGDAGADRVIRDAADLVGQTVAAACLLVAPERVIVVGAMARAGGAVLEPIREALERQTIPQTHATPEVVQGELGSLHTAKGAVALGLAKFGWLNLDTRRATNNG
jgi:predicted NBD/HSP70 family sugar kinase